MKNKKVVQIPQHINAGKVVPAHQRGGKTKEEVISLFDDVFNDPLSPSINNRDLKLKYMHEYKHDSKVLKNLYNQSLPDTYICAFIIMSTKDKDLLKYISETHPMKSLKLEALNKLKGA